MRFEWFSNTNEYMEMLLIWRSYYFYPKFKWNFKFKTKLKGVGSALYFECFIIASPTIAACQIYFLFRGRTPCC